MVQEYFTVTHPNTAIYQEAGSKFIAVVANCNSDDDFRITLNSVKKQYPKATHYCYAYSLVFPQIVKKSNDDGEPSGTAGLPILNKIQSAALENISVIVVRYYGGKKLGTSGLINAYKTATEDALTSAEKKLIHIYADYSLRFDYSIENLIRKMISQHNGIINEQHFSESIQFLLKIPLKHKNTFEQIVHQNPLIECYEV